MGVLVFQRRMQKTVQRQTTKIPPEIPFDIYRFFLFFFKTTYVHVDMLLRHHVIQKSHNYPILFRYIIGLMCFEVHTKHKMCSLFLLHLNRKYHTY
uniref:Uncharacterized protein n=1 Tax=Lactuca sativa TaxID=4236 RepID=A0A9R1VQ91_LACSA|nr:hypothetical protein LSAT_V11C400221990 [Lactuca sativa]